MSTATNFKRVICTASKSISFDPQVDVYFRDQSPAAPSRLDLAKLTTAYIALIEGQLVAEFDLVDEFFTIPEEIVLESIIAKGGAQTGPSHDVMHITSIIISRKSAPDMP